MNQPVKIGEILIEGDYLTPTQLEGFLTQQHKKGYRHLRLGELIAASGTITEDDLSDALAVQKARIRKLLRESM